MLQRDAHCGLPIALPAGAPRSAMLVPFVYHPRKPSTASGCYHTEEQDDPGKEPIKPKKDSHENSPTKSP